MVTRKGSTLVGSVLPGAVRRGWRRWYFRDRGGIPTAMTQRELGALRELADGATVLEIGSQFGASTVVMARVARLVVAVDWHRGDRLAGDWDTLDDYFAVLDRERVRDRVLSIVGRTEDALPLLRPRSFDVVFVDGAKDPASMEFDSTAAVELARPGGSVAFHDFGRVATVAEALQRLGYEPAAVHDTLAVVQVR